MKEIENSDQFNDVVKNQRFIIVDMFATWCGPCKRINEPMNQLSERYPHVAFVKLDIDKMCFMGIDLPEPDSIPCIIYMKDGQIVKMLNSSDMTLIENTLSVFTPLDI